MSYGGEGNPYNAGGFVQGGSPFGSQESPGGGKKGKSGTVRPVTVKQLLEASQVHSDAEHSIDGVDVGNVLLVGSVHNKSASATNVSYEIGDGTGYIDVRQWLDTADDEVGKMDGIEQDKYVAILGSIKNFGGKRHVSAIQIRLITDHNEVYHHLLKALYVSLSIRHPGGGGGGGAVHQDYSAGTTNGAAPGGTDNAAWQHLPKLHQNVMEFVAKEDSEDGMHVSVVARQVGAGNTEAVMDAIESLMQEGLLFSTIDDLHVKAI